jgi:hypothetical protein
MLVSFVSACVLTAKDTRVIYKSLYLLSFLLVSLMSLCLEIERLREKK